MTNATTQNSRKEPNLDLYSTGMGRHDKCCATIDIETGNLQVLVDDKWNLGSPTLAQITKIVRGNGWNGRWKFGFSVTPEPSKGSNIVVHVFTKI